MSSDHDAAFVDFEGQLSQFLKAESRHDSEEPNSEYWEETWHSVDDASLRQTLRATRQLGTHGPFFKRNLPPEAKILEAGCGMGLWVRRLRENGYVVTGLDYALESLRRSKGVVPELQMAAGDLLNLPYAGNSFDAYISFGVIEHFIDGPGPVLAEALRVLKPGGVALISTPLLNRKRMRVMPEDREDVEARGLRFHQYFFTLEDLRNHLSSAGFEIVPDCQRYSVWLGLGEHFPRAQSALSRLPLMSKLGHLADFLPWLPAHVAHMVFAVGRKPI